MEYRTNRQGPAPWVWVLIVLAAVILIFVIWWAVAAQPPEQTVIMPPEEREVERPPAEPAEQPVVVERECPVNIFIERERPTNVIVVPREEEPPQAREQLRQVDVPSRFRYQGQTWEPVEVVRGDDVDVRDTGASVQGNIVYAEQDATAPYNNLYLETEPGSDIYLRYRPAD